MSRSFTIGLGQVGLASAPTCEKMGLFEKTGRIESEVLIQSPPTLGPLAQRIKKGEKNPCVPASLVHVRLAKTVDF